MQGAVVASAISWCDKLASVPNAGFRFNQRYMPVEQILASWHPILDGNSEEGVAQFEVTRSNDFNFEVQTNRGFRYGADQTRIHVAFQHRMKVKSVSGAAPKVEMMSEPQPYTALLPEVLRRLVDATLLVPEIKERELWRVGVTSVTFVDEVDLPPGLAHFMEYLAKPWKRLSGAFTVQLTADVAEGKNWKDRCIHTLLRPELEDEVMTAQFDFQRLYNKPKAVTKETLQAASREIEDAGLAYFEQLAEGNMFDVAEREIVRAG